MDLTAIIVWLVVGGLAGWLASLVVRGGGSGIVVNIVVGIVGAVIANLIFGAGMTGPAHSIGITTFVYSVIGAIILLVVLNLIQRGRVVR